MFIKGSSEDAMKLRHSDGTLATVCPCCGSEWDSDKHEPVAETRGWSTKLNAPAWAWTCKSCLDEPA